MWEQREPFYVHHRTKVVTDVALRRSEPFQQQIEIKQHFCFPRYPPNPKTLCGDTHSSRCTCDTTVSANLMYI